MDDQITTIRNDTLIAVEAAGDIATLDDIRVRALGRKGSITTLMKRLGSLDPENRRDAGRTLNEAKDAVQAAIDTRRKELDRDHMAARLEAERLDVTLPPRQRPGGRCIPSVRPWTRSLRSCATWVSPWPRDPISRMTG